ncbi:hypothetical protein COV82_01960 [Candidatus Peregrinibacteria bacterium CG11_big_fil_rev_8_21_14_0_20_46_8]|nr:MAG: hypothetical protein COV82_01960 [Candidatus Peregrinibacteria bacterium CG11_big_fil_rev_8_21_14_0_20_46_8]
MLFRKKIAIWGVVTALFIMGNAAVHIAYAQPTLDPSADQIETLLNTKLKKKLQRATYFVFGIKERIAESKDELALLQNNIAELERKIDEKHFEIEDLSGQLANLDALIAANEEKIRAIHVQIAQTKNAISVLESEVQERQEILKAQRKMLAETISTYYLYANTLRDPANDQPNLLAFLAADESTGKVLQLHEYLVFLQRGGVELGNKVEQQHEAILSRQHEIEDKKKNLVKLAALLDQEQRGLELSKRSKERLLEETKGRQLVYETLLEISRREQEQVSIQILRLKENYDFVISRMDGLEESDIEGLLGESLEDFQAAAADLRGQAPLSWPVSPSRGLTALFHDHAYEKALGVRHNAVDIRLPQGSKVRAAADGVVSKAIDAGLGYSYIMIAHPNKLVTLYGHISEILVEEGEVVKQGQTIGLSGGIPGTAGAGWLTTGAHLHFEVFDNFKHVDPLYYLPLEFVPLESLPEKHLKRLTDDKVAR